MQDPCNDCIIKVNCTEICPKKENYKTLLRHVFKYRDYQFSHYGKYMRMLDNTIASEAKIRIRRRQARENNDY